MPSHEEHCQDSLRRYGKRFDELHSWMDEPSTVLGPSHRKYRHDPNKTPQIARVLFGPLADQACLDHIRLDELESRRKGVKRTREPQISSPLAFGFLSLLTFVVGIVIISSLFSTGLTSSSLGTFGIVIVGLAFFLPSFLFFLAFMGSLSQIGGEHKREETTSTQHEHGYNDINLEGYPEVYPATIVFNTCLKCGTKYGLELEKCPKCGTEKVIQTNNQRTS